MDLTIVTDVEVGCKVLAGVIMTKPRLNDWKSLCGVGEYQTGPRPHDQESI